MEKKFGGDFYALVGLVTFIVSCVVFLVIYVEATKFTNEEMKKVDFEMNKLANEMLVVRSKNVDKYSVCYDYVFNKNINVHVCVYSDAISKEGIRKNVVLRVSDELLEAVKYETVEEGGFFNKKEVVVDDNVTLFVKKKNKPLVEKFVSELLEKQ